MEREVRIQTATVADIPAILGLVEQYWKFEDIADFDADRVGALVNQLTRQSHLGAIWVARAAADCLGYMLVVFVFSLEFGGLVAEIDEFFVTDAARSRGIGRALLAAVESHLGRAGCVGMQLQLGKKNRAAGNFYRRFGYVERNDYQLLYKRLGDEKRGNWRTRSE